MQKFDEDSKVVNENLAKFRSSKEAKHMKKKQGRLKKLKDAWHWLRSVEQMKKQMNSLWLQPCLRKNTIGRSSVRLLTWRQGLCG